MSGKENKQNETLNGSGGTDSELIEQKEPSKEPKLDSQSGNDWDKPAADSTSVTVNRGKIKTDMKGSRRRNLSSKKSQGTEKPKIGSEKLLNNLEEEPKEVKKDKLDSGEVSDKKGDHRLEQNKGGIPVEQDEEETEIGQTEDEGGEMAGSVIEATDSLGDEDHGPDVNSTELNSEEPIDNDSSDLPVNGGGTIKDNNVPIEETDIQGVTEDREEEKTQGKKTSDGTKQDQEDSEIKDSDQQVADGDSDLETGVPTDNVSDKKNKLAKSEEVETVTNVTAGLGKYIKVKGSAKPICHWSFSESGKNEVLVDGVGGHNAIIHSRSRGTEVLPSDPEEEVFDDEYFEVAHSEGLKPEHGTLCFWFSLLNASEPATLVSCDSSDFSVNGGLNIRVSNGIVAFGMEDGEDKIHRISGGKVEEGVWYQVSITWGQNGLYLFLNGELIDSNKQFKRGLGKNTNDWIFGASRAGTTWLAGVSDVTSDEAEFFRGSIDDIALYNFQLNYVEMGILFEHGVEAYMNSTDEDVVEVPMNVQLTVAPPYTLGSVSVLFAGIPESVELSAGRDDGDGNLLLYNDNLIGLKFWTAELDLKFSTDITVKLRDVSGVDDELIKTTLSVKIADLEAEKLD